jgi:hypothetical protein
MTRTASFTASLAIAALAAIATTAPLALDTRGPGAAPPAATAPAAAVQSSAAAGSPEPAALPPVITYAEPPTDEQRKIVEWSVARYAEAGLALPSVEISFPPTCGGKAGRYFVGQAKIEVCKVHRKTVLHELAHAWDDSTSIDRDGFLRERGLDHWYEQPADRCHDSGGEQLALILTWGLMDLDLTHPVAERTGQPIDEQPRLLPGLPDGTPRVLAALFEQLTGTSPLTPS